MVATEEEMISAKVPLEGRDYCAHKLIQLMACRADVWPWAYKCLPEKHEYIHCQYEEYGEKIIMIQCLTNCVCPVFSYTIRLKDYERERRLMERKNRIEKRQGIAA